MTQSTKNHLKTAIQYTGAAVFWLIVWEVTARVIGKPLLLPSFSVTALKLIEMMGTADYWANVSMSLLRIGMGILIALVLGIGGGIIAGLNHTAGIILKPLLSVIRSTPVASFVVLLILWMNRNNVPSIITILTVFPIIFASMEEGIRQIDPDLLEVTKVFHMRTSEKIRSLYLPSLKPYLISSLQASLGLAWKSAVAAEVITLPMVSVGRQMYYASNNLDTPGTFAWTLTIILLSILVNRLVFLLTKLGTGKEHVPFREEESK